MKLADLLGHNQGFEMSYLVGCYERYRQCNLSHELQTRLCQHEIYHEELTDLESDLLLKSISLRGNILSPRVYHLGKIGIDPFRRQSLNQAIEINNSFDLAPTQFNLNECEELKKRATQLPSSRWYLNLTKVGLGIVCGLLFILSAKKLISSCGSITQKQMVYPAPKIVKGALPEITKLAAGILLYFNFS